MEKLFEVAAGPALASGISPAQPAVVPLLWKDSDNVLFEDGIVRKLAGQIELAATGTRPTGICAALTPTEARAYVGIADKYYRYRTLDGLTEIGALTATGGTWVFLPRGTHVLASNGVDELSYWDGASASAVTTPFGLARTLCKFASEYALAADTDLDNDIIYNCAATDFENWTTGNSGAKQIRDINSGIRALVPMADFIGVYTGDELWSYRYTGTAVPFATRRLIRGIGAISHYSVVDTGSRHFGMMPQGVFETDGVSFGWIDQPHMRSWFLENLDLSRKDHIAGFHDPLNNSVEWFVPIIAGGYAGVGFRYDTRTWFKTAGAESFGIAPGVFDDVIVSDATSLRRRDRVNQNIAGVAMPSSLQTKPIDCGTRLIRKTFKEVQFDVTFSGTVQCQLGWSDEIDDAITWDSAQALARSVRPAGGQREANFIHVKVFSEAVDANWKLSGLRIYGDRGGNTRQ